MLIDARQLLRQQRLVTVLLEQLAILPLDALEMGENPFQRTKLFEQRDGPLGSDPRHARNVIHFVADESQVVDEVVGQHAPLFAHQLGVVSDVL